MSLVTYTCICAVVGDMWNILDYESVVSHVTKLIIKAVVIMNWETFDKPTRISIHNVEYTILLWRDIWVFINCTHNSLDVVSNRWFIISVGWY